MTAANIANHRLHRGSYRDKIVAIVQAMTACPDGNEYPPIPSATSIAPMSISGLGRATSGLSSNSTSDTADASPTTSGTKNRWSFVSSRRKRTIPSNIQMIPEAPIPEKNNATASDSTVCGQ